MLYGVQDGQFYRSSADTYSIATYAYSQLEKTAVAASLKTLCADLLRYGSAAQIYKDYRTDALADSNMTAEHKIYLSDTENLSFGNTSQMLDDLDTPMITWVGKALDLNSKVALKFIFDMGSYAGSVEALELKITYTDHAGQSQTRWITEAEAYGNSVRRYAFNFDGLLAAELRTVMDVAVYEGDTQLSQTLRYSSDTYGNNKTGKLLELCKALFAYSDSAKAYFVN